MLRSEASVADSAGWGWRQTALIFAVALVPRLVHFWYVQATPLAGQYVPDLSAYLYFTERLMQSRLFFAEPLLMSPGYALLLAPQYILFGPDVPVFVLVNAVLDAASAALCAGLAARLAPAGREFPTGLAAGLLYALCGPLLFYALLPLGEGPSVFCLLAGLTLLFRAGGKTRGGGACAWLAGALFALGALMRPNLAPALLLGLGAWCLGRDALQRARIQAAGRCLAGMLLVFAPFMAHNAVVAGSASPFGYQGGVTLYTGNHPGASGVGEALPGFDNTPYVVLTQAWAQAREQSGRPLNLAEADAYWYAKTWDFFASHPGEAALLLGRKALLLFNEQGVDATADLAFCARFSPVPGLLALPLGLVFALAAVGLPACLGQDGRSGPEFRALAAQLTVLAGLAVLFLVVPRYRVLLVPLAIPFAARGCLALPDVLRGLGRDGGREFRRLRAVQLAAFITVLGLSLVPLRLLVSKPGNPALEHARLAHYYFLTGQQSLAQAEYQAALKLGAPEPERLRAELAASRLLGGQGPEQERPPKL